MTYWCTTCRGRVHHPCHGWGAGCHLQPCTTRPRDAGICPFCAAGPGEPHTDQCGLRDVPWGP